MSHPTREFGARIYNLRLRKCWSGIELARRVGVTVSIVFDWEAGQSMPNNRHLLALARSFDLQVEDLLQAS